ncbi:piezo-type mechanosensitive ion channel component isoform X1 [Drosophila grimshawi]|uniref:piezo-type mechanosensitive ion channel component isoform X1 n=1 Tax=Drosophila grimshawi TaxID=7222 RepID=UPI000C870F78|nr:piezo-type mechanosensitive ion channel component isoform X1 [Drosophila grimshawi]
MAFSYACLVLQRVVVPAVLVLASLMRPVGISFVYMLMFFLSPFIPLATRRTFKGSVTAFFLILVALSAFVLLGHIALQVLAVSITLPIYDCSFSEQLLRHIGFISFLNLKPLAIAEWLTPEVLVFATSLGSYLSVKKLATQTISAEQLENGDLPESQSEHAVSQQAGSDANGADVQQATATTPLQQQQQQLRKRVSMISQHIHFEGLIKISPLFCLATLFFAAALRPSVPGGFYFLIFLLAGTYWATCQTLQRGFALLLRCVMVVLVLHSLCIVSYQTPWMQDHLNHTSLTARLIGLEPLIESTCSRDIRVLLYNNTLTLDSYLNPFAVFFAYFAMALTTKHLIKPRVSLRREQRATLNEPTETTPLVRQSTRKARTPQALELSGAAPQPASGSHGNDIQLDSMDRRSEQENNTTSILDQISYGFVSVGGFIYQNSYIFTNILMMAWSIVYHSWLTFVLLLWANVLWMIPNQRKAMMRSSPFIVIYAELLLVAQYIYGMDLNNDELPTKVSTAGINLQQIGFERPIENQMRPCVPLIVKTAFVLMFWVTSRQFFKEKRDRRRNSTLADIIAPLQITVGSAGSTYLINDGKKTSKFLKKAGDVIKNLLVRLWIWLLVLVIFLCAITGEYMTGFRICYMALFLFFLLVFQSSSKAWVKIMYGFWLFLIFYAMSILILIYTYQFDKFDTYWKDYLNVSQTLQADIGLKRYKTKDLFLHLVSPTIIVILTVIQVHYFHKRFIASLQQQPTAGGQQQRPNPALEPAPSKRRGSASSLRRSVGPTAEATAAGGTSTDFETSVRDLVRISFRKIKNKSEYIFKRFKTVFWRFLELHIMKAVYIAAFVCSVSEVCVLHIVFVGFCVLGATSRKAVQVVISRLISFIVTIIVLSKMIYQIEYLDHTQYNVMCSDNRTANNAEWIGLNKANKLEGGLMSLLRTYIIYMVIVTMHAVISLRQLQMRIKIGENSVTQQKLLFQNITRADAEKDLVGLVKYLLNFGFYKFGIEISLIALVSTITYRQDIVAVAYALWLVVLLLLKRSQCAKMWGIFQAFFAVSILLQYIVLVGLPPSWCMVYPWDDDAFGESIQRWTMLPGSLHFNHVPKLIFDFIVLIILNRQKSIFVIEQRYATADDYPGGSNRSVIADIAQLGRVPFDNPTHDFCSYIRNYSDILKNGVLCGFYWFTLAVVFLAGTNIADLLALGYLIGAFIFLWQGSDFYLRPITTIISRWKWLLAFNVANILIKTSFQMAGCLFMTPLTTHCCWLVHMLGITCTSNVLKEQLLLSEEADLHVGPDECPKITHQIVLLWDAICFAFIIFQLRIFKSHYFCHIITDTKANNILASRGADIIETLRQKQIAHRHDHEKQVLHKIKRKMERIRATQQKMLRPLDKQTHFDEHGYPFPAPTVRRRKETKLHPHATRAGDYYMFEEMDDKFELDLIHDEIDFLEEENITESEMKMQRRKTLYDKSKDAPTDLFPSTSRGISKERDAATFSSPKPVKDVTDLPTTTAAAAQLSTAAPREATSKETSDSKSKMEVDSGDVTAKDSDEDFDTNPIIRLLEGFLVTLTIRLNRFSRNYRFVNRILAGEKKTLKESSSLNRLGLSSAAAMFHFLKSNLESDENGGQPVSSSTPRRSQLAATTTTTTLPTTTSASTTTDNLTIEHFSTPLNTNTTTTPLTPPEPHVQPPAASTPHVVEDIIAIPVDTVDAAISRKQSISSSPPNKGAGDFNLEEENFAQRDHHIIVEVLISSWYALLANTDLICYIVVFINQVVNASVISLPLPIMVFLWGTLSLPRPTKTFWVTLIAYTQAIVLIKCIFQFKLIWANYQNLAHQPLRPAKIFGVEMKTHYAVYDLILLLVLFLHRYLLKSQGLWKSGYKDTDQQFAKPTTSIDDREDSDNMSQPDSRQLNEDAAQKQSLQVSQVSLPGSPEYSKSAINQLERTKYTSSLHKFFFSLVHKSRLATDVYALMFLCDFINFFVLLFGFTAFGTQQTESDGGVQTYLAENKVPVPFLIMLLVQFLLIVIDRALYLRKALVNKIFFHFFSVIGIHIWMFFVVPAVTERSFNSLAPPIIFYVIKCFYMLLSSYQIKSGYPKRILGNFFTKGFSMVNMIAFKVYMQIPFLYELRTILDWVCIDSTMTIFDWLKMEDIFSNIYLIRCTRQSETDFPAMRAQKKASLSKLIMGGTIVLLIVICIWGPLCLFALGNAVGTSNVPHQVSVSIRIGPYDPIYTTNNYDSIFPINTEMYNQMTNTFIKNKTALTFIAGYDATDVAAVRLAGNSPSLWNIAPPDKQRLTNDLRNNNTLIARFSYSLTRDAPAKGLKENVGDEHIINLDSSFEGRAALISMLTESYDQPETGNDTGSNNGVNGTTNSNDNTTTTANTTTTNSGNVSNEVVVVLPHMIPKFIKVLNLGDAFVVSALTGKEQEYRPLVIKMHRDNTTNGLWWEIRDFCYDNFYNSTLKDLPYSDCSSGIVMYTFNDKKFPSTFSFLTAGGIIGLYTTFVLLASRFMKSFIGGQNRKIMFEDLPYVDRVLQLCLDIYLVREALEFALEEDLFAKLLFLYRSPETLIKWTRPKEEYLDDDGDTDSIPSRMSVRRNEQLQQQQQQHQYQQQQQQ